MKINIPVILLLMLAALNGCGVSKTAAGNSQSNPNIEVKTGKTGEAETVSLKDSKSETDALKEVISDDGDFKFKMPCDLRTQQDDAEKEFIGKEKTHTQVCDADKVKLSVSSKKSKLSLKEEFEKLKIKEKASEGSFKGTPFIEYTKSSTSTTTKKVAGFPESKESATQITKNKIYLVNDNWTINFEVSCNSNERNYCENIFAEDDGTVSRFFASFEMLK